ncbi:MAG: CPBP family glutamic-type intramembrane protease [Planctomycetota bacterium]|nr:CPBP family glutamic-type intramembrane protease [Planctomycetota bacterium]
MTTAETASSRPSRRGSQSGAGDRADHAAVESGLERTLALGWIAVLPLVVAYELALALEPASPRNTAEYVLTLPFQGLFAHPELGRYGLEIVATLLAGWAVFHGELGLVRRATRIAVEGFVGAILLGPLLLLLLHALEVSPPAIGRPESVPSLTLAALLVGGAAFEEVVFRVGVFAALVVLARATFDWFLGLPRTARVLAEITALVGSAVVFAAAHLAPVVGLVSPGGEPYDGARFAWRATAGLALALLFRWRGMGVAAWCHAFFNLALALGAGPEVFL